MVSTAVEVGAGVESECLHQKNVMAIVAALGDPTSGHKWSQSKR